mgnify:CR=1 FL=1
MKRGFTLVELLGVLLVLAVIALITFPIVTKSIKDNKERLYNSQLEEIKLGAEKWAYKNLSLLPDQDGETITVTLLTLKESGDVPLDVRDPRTGELIPNDMMITIEFKNNDYIITIDTESGSDITDDYNENAPIIVLNGGHVEFVEINSQYNEQGAKAISKAGTTLSNIDIIYQENGKEVASVDTSKFTTYTAIYSVTDNGYTSRVTRTIVIRDTTAPNLVIPNNVELTKEQLISFDLLEGVSATDNSGETINVETRGFDTLPTDKIVEYKACDSRNNCVTKRRLIKIKQLLPYSFDPDEIYEIFQSPDYIKEDIIGEIELKLFDEYEGVNIYTCDLYSESCSNSVYYELKHLNYNLVLRSNPTIYNVFYEDNKLKYLIESESESSGITGYTTIHIQFINEDYEPTPWYKGIIWASCLSSDSEIIVYDKKKKKRKRKKIRDLNYDDLVLAWDFDKGEFTYAKPLWIMKQKTIDNYNLLKFSDGSILKTINQHRIFNKEKGKFTYPMTDDTPLGTTTFNSKGEEVTLIEKKVIYENIDYCNVITNYHINLFTNDILTSCRFNNIYEIENMKFKKINKNLNDGKKLIGISKKWIDGLRLKEQDLDINKNNIALDKDIFGYIKRLEQDDIINKE